MKKGTTLFLKASVILIGIPVITIGVMGLYFLVNNPVSQDYAYFIYPIIFGIYSSFIPFYIALHQAFRLLGYIDTNYAFSEASVIALRNIKRCGIAISIIYALNVPFVFRVADLDDAPGLILFGMIPVFASAVIAVFAAVLQRLLKEAIDIKSENDLTI